MTDTSKEAAWDALMNYQQADEDGVMVLVSRQAIHECKAERDALRKAVDSYSYIGRDGKMVLAKDLEDERDALRAQLQAARDEALEEAAEQAISNAGSWEDAEGDAAVVISNQIRALKSTSAEGEG
ncbi:hypothetical protein J7363_04855 [Phaeobacter italicus]|uniref:hypothetical protein n=1 Tax=Phaeobacter italicus TaxID=481446 RepID=UPI001ADBEFF4|nr:hypothetical protein [Phaeobacter italicus]MBO9441411.1 hypothetical protein [Phaeobacter italicus]